MQKQRRENLSAFLRGIRHGIPIALGYFAVSLALGIKAQSTLSYRIKKMDAFIRDHREELEDLFR